MNNAEILNTARLEAIRVFGSHAYADQWLGSPRFLYWDRTPVELLAMPGGLDRVLQTLAQIEADPSTHVLDFTLRAIDSASTDAQIP